MRGEVLAREDLWAIGVDLGGTKIDVAQVGEDGNVRQRLRFATKHERGPAAVKSAVIAAARELWQKAGSPPVGVGVGVAGQIEQQHGIVRFSPNLGWRDEPFQADLHQALGIPIVVTNDVRAATWGEWLHGAGRGCADLVCLFVGTGIGGGVVSGGQVLSGCTNSAAELGHITVDINGPFCRCGNRGCLEALAGGWAIAQHAREAVQTNPAAGAYLLKMAGDEPEAITAQIVAQAARSGDPLAVHLIEKMVQALISGGVSLVNAFNPCRFILGGGIIEGMPHLVERISQGVKQQALAIAAEPLQILPAQLHQDAGVVGAAALAIIAALKGKRES